MFKTAMFLITTFLGLSANLEALSDVDKFFLRNGTTACNGPGPNCDTFLREDVQLNDNSAPVSPEWSF